MSNEINTTLAQIKKDLASISLQMAGGMAATADGFWKQIGDVLAKRGYEVAPNSNQEKQRANLLEAFEAAGFARADIRSEPSKNNASGLTQNLENNFAQAGGSGVLHPELDSRGLPADNIFQLDVVAVNKDPEARPELTLTFQLKNKMEGPKPSPAPEQEFKLQARPTPRPSPFG